MPEQPLSCVQPTAGPLGGPLPEKQEPNARKEEKPKMIARVGKPAPDFEANAFVGDGFKKIKLSDYHGKWVLLCFYPGDFTFV